MTEWNFLWASKCIDGTLLTKHCPIQSNMRGSSYQTVWKTKENLTHLTVVHTPLLAARPLPPTQCTGCILTIYIRNWHFTGLFWDFWGSLRLLCDPKIGRKLLLGQKYSLVSFDTSKEAVCQKEEIHDLVFWGCNSGWLKEFISSSCIEFWIP